MTKEQQEVLKNYISQIEEVANRAQTLQSHVDAAYKKILQTEVKGYRDLVKIWGKRLKDGI